MPKKSRIAWDNRKITFSACCLCFFILLVSLGTWQVQRLQWKTALVEDIAIKSMADPVEFPLTYNHDGSPEFTKVTAIGIFLHSHEITVIARYYKGKQGVYIITPLRLKDGTMVLVNRGWLPDDMKDPLQRPETHLASEITIQGILCNSDRGRWFMPQNYPEKDRWFLIDIPMMADYIRKHYPDTIVRPVLIQATGEVAENTYPKPLPNTIKLVNDHLEYAITWYTLAVIVVIMYILYLRQENEPQNAREVVRKKPARKKKTSKNKKKF